MLSLIVVALTAAAAPVTSGEVFVKLPAGATLKGDSAQWGEWIADVERPQQGTKFGAVGGMHRADGLAQQPQAGEAHQRQKEIGAVPAADVDGNGTVDALTDGVLIVRYNSATARAKVSKVDSFSIKQKALTAPRPSGSVLVKLPQPWPACTVGDRFNGVYLTIGATHRYRLDGLEVARCSAEDVAFVYSKAQAE